MKKWALAHQHKPWKENEASVTTLTKVGVSDLVSMVIGTKAKSDEYG